MSTVEDKFEEIAKEAVAKAERVKCDPQDFVEGLRCIMIEIQERLQMAKDEYGTGEEDWD